MCSTSPERRDERRTHAPDCVSCRIWNPQKRGSRGSGPGRPVRLLAIVDEFTRECPVVAGLVEIEQGMRKRLVAEHVGSVSVQTVPEGQKVAQSLPFVDDPAWAWFISLEGWT